MSRWRKYRRRKVVDKVVKSYVVYYAVYTLECGHQVQKNSTKDFKTLSCLSCERKEDGGN